MPYDGAMAAPILVTKLYIPRLRPGAISRPRLVARLNGGLHHTLTLISAPPGFGKTSLISEWVAGCGRPVAWLSLDDADSDPVRFLEYLVAALRIAAPGIGEEALATLRSAQSVPAAPVLIALLNEIATLPEPILLVLDDYHLVDSVPVDEAVAFLLAHIAPQFHLAIATREDPRLPLSRFRARGEMTEIRASDLRFDASEAAAFLTGSMNLELSTGEIEALETRTEGWIAGLQLAALSIQGRTDVSGFIREFAGGDRHVVDYLVEEVLQRQPEPVRAFLLQTAILDRLSGPLCDAVTGRDDSRRLLDSLERGNLFLIPLDDARRWYRYHHLFADVLRVHAVEDPDRVADRHHRASVWYAQHGLPAEAIRHALAARDFDRAADLIEPIVPGMNRDRQEATLLGWLKALPDDLFRARPVLNLGYVGSLLSNGEIAGAEEHLRDTEQWLEPSNPDMAPAAPIVVDEFQFQRLPRAIAVYRSGLAMIQGDIPATVTHARRALDLTPVDDHLWRGAASALLGLAFWTQGSLDDAYEAYAEGMASLGRAGNVADVIGGGLALADIRLAQGNLHDAKRIYERGLHLAVEHGTPTIRGTADMHVGLGDLHREHGDLEAARQHLLRSREQGEHTGFPQHRYRWRLATARLREAEDDPAASLDLLDEAEHAYVSDFYPNVRPVAAYRVRALLALERLDDALTWVRERRLAVEDDLSYLREFEHMTLARVLLWQFLRDPGHIAPVDGAIGLLQRLRDAARAGGRTGSEIEILVLLALTHDARGDEAQALTHLERALVLAEPEGYVRVFVGEGPPMARLLAELNRRGVSPAYTRRLLEVFPAPDQGPEIAETAGTGLAAGLLSPRELEVIRLIAQGHSNREIGDRLFLALDTVKGHNRRIFARLEVGSRTEAIARARELGLLD